MKLGYQKPSKDSVQQDTCTILQIQREYPDSFIKLASTSCTSFHPTSYTNINESCIHTFLILAQRITVSLLLNVFHTKVTHIPG